ncbi:SH3 domain-containing protein [Lysobacter arenosi]|uniref:SH3 domain-containing protein n=1 Tax=Lysobacter arenosi TaxID=2795387 RepID=A0ABX7RB78_9GAMM|nr:SH3 domain-containing protein [Lysobacter arenosi]QSX75395.1 SH3 domain-containing protein [Lysobacter arenosi]
MRLTLTTPALALSLALCLAGTALQPLAARERAWTVPASTGVIGVDHAQLDPAFWVRQLADPDRVILDSDAIAAQNTRLHQLDKSIHDLAALQDTLDRAQVSGWIEALSRRPSKALFDERGKPVAKATLDEVVDSINLGAVPERQDTRYGLVVHRAALRTFPTSLRVFSSDDDHDIDRFQESALFPGDPVVVAHESRDGQWWFVVNPRYAAWVEKRFVALGSQEQVLGYGRKAPYRVVTGARAATVFTQEEPGVSELQLDMGLRVPVLADWPVGKAVNGQDGYTSHVIELPVRNDDGSLRFAPALLPRREPSQDHYLPLSGRNLIEQGFKFLGERYGWGHSYNGRDCSGFVSEIYRSMGVELPRNTSDQAVSPALNRIALSDKDSRERRLQIARELQVGDLVYIPGHVMMVIGQLDGEPYVIHDTTGLSFAGADGKTVRAKTNGVTVSPLTPLLFNGKQTYVDRMTNIQRIRP